MSSKQRDVTHSVIICLGFGFLASFLAAAPAAYAQYPTQSQVSKDGTAVMLEDYANPPLSNATHSGANTAATILQHHLPLSGANTILLT